MGSMYKKIAVIFIKILIPVLIVAELAFITTHSTEIPVPGDWPSGIVKEVDFSERNRISETSTGSQLFAYRPYSPQVESLRKIDDETYIVTFSSEERPVPCNGLATEPPAPN